MRFYKWAGISLLIHAAVVLPFMFTVSSAPPPKAREARLEMELFDMVSVREKEEPREAETETSNIPDMPDVPAPAPPEPKPEAQPAPLPDEPEPVAVIEEPPVELADEPQPQQESVAENPVMLPDAGPVAGYAVGLAADTGAAGAPDGAGVFLPLAGGGVGGGTGKVDGNDAVDRSQESLRRQQAEETDRLNRYTSMVARRLQANLVYPANMRRKGVEAATTIAFTVTGSGEIRADSLRVRTSSGYKEMDDNALRAARESAPFDKPPKELTLVIELAFEVGRR